MRNALLLLFAVVGASFMESYAEGATDYRAEIGGVVYTWHNEGQCQASAASVCEGDIVVKRKVECSGANGKSELLDVNRIYTDGFKGKDITSIKIEERPADYNQDIDGFRLFTGAFKDCVSLQVIELPADLILVQSYGIIENTPRLTAVICNGESPAGLNIQDGMPPAINATLYVPDGSVDAYKGAEFWKRFNDVKPLSEYDAPTDPGSGQTSVVIGLGHGRMVLPQLPAGAEIRFEANDGYDVVFQGENRGSSYVYAVPDNAGEIEIAPTFSSRETSSAQGPAVSVPRLRVVGNDVEVCNAGGETVVITDIGGAEMYRGHGHRHSLCPGVYVVTVGQYNFKVAI